MKTKLANNINKKMSCSNCASLIDENSVICNVCNGINSDTSTMDPVQSLYGKGRFYRNLAITKPKLIELIGTWIMLFPCFIVGLGFAIYILLTGIGGGFSSFIFFWAMALLAYASFILLYRVTRKYFALAPREIDEWD